MKKINKVFVIILVFILSSYPCTLFANTEDQVLSFEEYKTRLEAAYAEADPTAEVKVIKMDDPNFVYTKEFLDLQIAGIPQLLRETNFELVEIKDIKNTNNKNDGIMPHAMYYTEYYTKNYVFQNKTDWGATLGYATIYLEIHTTNEAQRGVICSVDYHTSYQIGQALNFDSWTETSFNTTGENTGVVTYELRGRMTCSGTVAGQKLTVTRNQGVIEKIYEH